MAAADATARNAMAPLRRRARPTRVRGLLTGLGIVAALAAGACGDQASSIAPDRARHSVLSMAGVGYDPVSQRVIAFGGNLYLPHYVERPSNATYAWTGSRWLRLSPASSPPGRQHPHLVTVDGRLLVVGGDFLRSGPDRPCSNQANCWDATVYGDKHRADTWRWTGRTWRRVVARLGPTWMTL